MKVSHLFLGIFCTATLFSSCIKQKYDNAPDTSSYDPNLKVTKTIHQLDSMAYSVNTGANILLGNDIIYGIVTADDRSGNFYKQIVIQDSTGGITISIAVTNLYVDYPIGRKIYVNLKGLYLMNYKGLPIIADTFSTTGSPSGIPSAILQSVITKASYPHTVTPIPVSMSTLATSGNLYYNMLVTITNTQFSPGSTGVLYAQPTAKAISTSDTLFDCDLGGGIVLYNSSYATFAPAVTPNGNGSITGIFSAYTTPQFLIRDTSDVRFTNARKCP